MCISYIPVFCNCSGLNVATVRMNLERICITAACTLLSLCLPSLCFFFTFTDVYFVLDLDLFHIQAPKRQKHGNSSLRFNLCYCIICLAVILPVPLYITNIPRCSTLPGPPRWLGPGRSLHRAVTLGPPRPLASCLPAALRS